MPSYQTPGVYVEEIATLPPSIASVSTAVPAFLGYTERGSGIARIDTYLEFEQTFGGAKPTAFEVTVSQDTGGPAVRVTTLDGSSDKFFLAHALRHYFANGGGPCYVVSVGNYGGASSQADFVAGLELLALEDEPTLIVPTDAIGLTDAADYHSVCQAVLRQCSDLGDRFAILDVQEGDDAIATFRNGLGTNDLKYGAAYYPFLETTLAHAFDETEIDVIGSLVILHGTFGNQGFLVEHRMLGDSTPEISIEASTAQNPAGFSIDGTTLKISLATDPTSARALVEAWDDWKAENDPQGFDIKIQGDGSEEVKAGTDVPLTSERNPTISELESIDSALYNQIKGVLARQRVVLPPSAAVAGVYASVDRDRGVWKAPANVSLASVIGPTVKISSEMQAGLNVDPQSGKSINAIRAFNGKGTLIWGARTLAGNDNEWRYVSVRRLFNMIEESARKATSFAVFEPNDITTWLKVQGMIESFLYGLWEQGALAGPTPEAAYFVHVGLGKTMTTQDVLEGRMIIEIGIAAVRPAEFIILRFSHKLQES